MNWTSRLLLTVLVSCFVVGCKPTARAETPGEIPVQALAEVERLQRVFGVPLTTYPAQAGEFTVPAASALTAAKLPGKPLQDDPPQLGQVPVYPEQQQDLVDPPTYQVPGLGTFRFRYFNNEMAFGRDHTWPMNDYSSVHGFNLIAPNERDPQTITWMPPGTRFPRGFGIGRAGMVKSLGIEDPERLDLLVDLGEEAVIEGLIKAGTFKNHDPEKYDEWYLDMEEGCPNRGTLRAKAFFPKEGTPEEQAAFEKKWYTGLAMILYCPIEAARRLGFKDLCIYGWNPDWWEADGDPEQDYYWQNIGKLILPHLDWVCSCNYYTRPSIANVAARLCDTDSNLRYLNTLPPEQRKPLRPFFSNQFIHYVPWCYLAPATNEEMQATTALQAFTQYDGYLLWCNAVLANDQSCNDNLPPPLTKDVKVRFRETYTAEQEGGGAREFRRYDLISVLSVEGPQVRFQFVDADNQKDHGLGADYPVYLATAEDLTPHLLSPFECLQGMYEGLAMAKQVEWTLRHGTIVWDFDSQEVHRKLLPIERHLQAGNLHVVATYDPQVVYGKPARDVLVRDFAGVEGLNLTFPTDSQVRIYLVKVQ